MMTADEYIAKATWLADMHALSGPTEHTRQAIEAHATVALRRNKEVRDMLEEEAERAADLGQKLAESERQRDALKFEVEALRTALSVMKAAMPEPEVDGDVFVQPVPDHCDRITWRNRYYHLPTKVEMGEKT